MAYARDRSLDKQVNRRLLPVRSIPILIALSASTISCRNHHEEPRVHGPLAGVAPAPSSIPATSSAAPAGSAASSASGASSEHPGESVSAVRVLVVSTGNYFLRAALLDGAFDVQETRPEVYPVSGPFDVTIFDGTAPPVAADAGSLIYLGATGKYAPCPTQGLESAGDRGFDRITDTAPMLHFTDLAPVSIVAIARSTPRTDDLVLGAASDGAPLLVTGSRDQHRFTALMFDIRQSDLALRIDWPILLVQAIGAPLSRDLFALPVKPPRMFAPPAHVGPAPPDNATRATALFDAATRGFTSAGYRRMYPDYRELARQRLGHSEIPPRVRAYVERYFDAIAPPR